MSQGYENIYWGHQTFSSSPPYGVVNLKKKKKIKIKTSVSKVCELSRGWHEGSLYFTLDTYLLMLSVKQGGIKYHIFRVFGMTWPGNWRTLYSLGQWIGKNKCNQLLNKFFSYFFYNFGVIFCFLICPSLWKFSFFRQCIKSDSTVVAEKDVLFILIWN